MIYSHEVFGDAQFKEQREVSLWYNEGMLASLDPDARWYPVPELPGALQFQHRYEGGERTLRDTRIYAPNGTWVCGLTYLLYKDVPYWSMQYQGQYAERAIPFLKRVLRDAYEHGTSVAGRGPLFAEDAEEGLVYTNRSDGRGKFTLFSGEEMIFVRGNGAILGSHTYAGQWLLNDWDNKR